MGGVPIMGVSYKVGDKGCIFYFSPELVFKENVYGMGQISDLLLLFKAVLVWIFMYFIRHCFICRPLDSTVSDDAGIEPGSVTRCNHWTHKLYILNKLSFYDTCIQFCLCLGTTIFTLLEKMDNL